MGYDFLRLEGYQKELANVLTAINGGVSTSVFGAIPPSRCHIASGIDKLVLYVVPDIINARTTTQLISEYSGVDAVFLPSKDDVLVHRQGYQLSSLSERMKGLSDIILGRVKCVVITADSLLQYLPNREMLENKIVKIKVNQDYNIDELIVSLASSGYKQETLVEQRGTFARRGDILDVWAVDNDLPIRIEFFGDTVESIRLFAPDSMMSVKSVDEIIIIPLSDILLTDNVAEKVSAKLTALRSKSKLRLAEVIDEVITQLSLNPSDPSLVWITPFITKNCNTILDYIPSDSVIILDEARLIDEKIKLTVHAHFERVKNFTESGDATADHKYSILNKDDAYKNMAGFTKLAFQQITSSNPCFNPDAVFSLKTLNVPNYSLNYPSFITDLRNYSINGTKVAVFAGTSSTANTIRDLLTENNIGADIVNDAYDTELIAVLPMRIGKGVIYPSEKLSIIGTDDIVRRSEAKKRSLARKRVNFVMPVKGDYVVHEKHGIGLSEGVVTLTTKNGVKDYYLILYKGGDKLYLPIDQMDSLERYNGGDKPTIHKLGGKEFERIKERVKQSVKKIAFDLIELYEKRHSTKGYKYPPDTVWQKELEDSFEFTETDDQLLAISEIKEDMESGKVMDRLLCGDVGYGKTEVAIRAIFKTILEGKQAVLLAPTTILCQQHYNTIRARLNKYNIKVDLLSRFVSQDGIKGALKRIKAGDTSIIVATHRVLSKDVVFKDLGLLVLDEEQRFGVEHKDKIKVLKNNINVLALSATPIPRTLHMSLSGIRDISTLEQAPSNRLPIETYVIEYTDSLIVDAVRREVNRGGQVYILFNRVKGIEKFYNDICNLLDGIAVIYAHGQMGDGELEDRIRAFYNKEAQVLISTTIIENGIDLPDANTLIVVDSDRLGLSQLYQLRGRVGRSNVLAYAYFTLPVGKVLTTNAQKRLDALMNFTELGSGFKIAMQDLEIRGAGNILGAEQHGIMEKVGYDMYCKILKECVDDYRGIKIEQKLEVEIIVDADTTLPKDYIIDGESRVKFYKRASIISSKEEQQDMIVELTDIYGKPPISVTNLLNVGLIKTLSQKLAIKKVYATREGLGLFFYDVSLFKNERAVNAISDLKKLCVLTTTNPPSIIFKNVGLNGSGRLQTLIEFLNLAV